MTEKKEDRRIRKTRDSLRLAMVGLLHKCDWDDISIQMICDDADVARSSFYVHFDNKIALLDHVFSSREGEIKEFVTQTPQIKGGFTTLSWLVDHISESKELYRYANRSISGQVILSRFKSTIREVFRHELTHIKTLATDDQIDFIFGGVFALIQQWLETNAQCSEQELKSRIYALTLSVIDKDIKIGSKKGASIEQGQLHLGFQT